MKYRLCLPEGSACWTCLGCLPLVNNVSYSYCTPLLNYPVPGLDWSFYTYRGKWIEPDVVTEWMPPVIIVSTSCFLQSSRIGSPTNDSNPALFSEGAHVFVVLIKVNALSLCGLRPLVWIVGLYLCSHSVQLFMLKSISCLQKWELFR